MASLVSIFDSSANQRRWIGQIHHFLEKEISVETNVPVSIFRVPATLSVYKPDAYVPRVVGLGAYHHFQPDLYEMQRYKLAAASRLHKEFQSIEFKDLVIKLADYEDKVRASYHKYLDMDGETLIWIMAIDGLFLIDLLRGFVTKDNDMSSTTTQLVDSAGKKLANDALLSDIMMLENQIPIFFLIELLSALCTWPDVTTKMLPSMWIGFCKSVSPLKVNENYPLPEVSKHAHLLDLLYHMTVPMLEGSHESIQTYSLEGGMSFADNDDIEAGNSDEVFSSLWKFSSKLNLGQLFDKIAKPINMLVGVPWNMATKFVSKAKGKSKDDKEGSSNNIKPPIVEEIIVPSVTDLCRAGVSFFPTDGDITTIKFDQKYKIFYLPVTALNVNSEVIMRNLVAYEASTLSEALVFTRYLELMNGIIDTADDAKILREKKIIVNSLKSDIEVANLFNGMSKAIRLTSVPYIDMAIGDVNKYYHGTLRVRLHKQMKKYVYRSWKLLTILAALLMMLLMALQSFCTVYSCPKLLKTTGIAAVEITMSTQKLLVLVIDQEGPLFEIIPGYAKAPVSNMKKIVRISIEV